MDEITEHELATGLRQGLVGIGVGISCRSLNIITNIMLRSIQGTPYHK